MKIQRLFILVIAGFAFSCQTSQNTFSPGNEFEVVSPETVGLNSDSLKQVEELIQWAIDSQYIAGGVALVAKEDQIVYYEAIGFSDREKTDILEEDDIFRIASMTKPITTTAIMQLHEEGKLAVNDPVSNYIPEFANPVVVDSFNEADSTYTTRPSSREITLHDLLTHTSGMAYGVFMPKAGAIYSDFGVVEGWTKDSVLLADNAKTFAKLPLMHDPGAQWTYSTSIDVLGRVVEVVSGQPLDKYFEEHIFAPLGMSDTYFYLPESKSGRLVDVWFTEDVMANDGDVWLSENYPVSGARTYFAGGAGLSSTVLDYYKFTRALLNGGERRGNRILESETVDMMMSNQIDSLYLSPGEQFGYGFSVYSEDGPYGRKAGRFSWGGYWQTIFWVDPARDMIGILFTNANGTPMWGRILDGFEERVNNSVAEL